MVKNIGLIISSVCIIGLIMVDMILLKLLKNQPLTVLVGIQIGSLFGLAVLGYAYLIESINEYLERRSNGKTDNN